MDKKNTPLVSVVVPIYNSEKYIQRCINSITNQTYTNIEIILIDDGSIDSTSYILEQSASRDNRIKVISKKNEGVANTRNLGIRLANGKYIMFIDNDDYIPEIYVQTYVEAIEKQNLDLVIGGYQRVNIHGNCLFSDYPRDSNWGKYIILAPWAKIYRVKLIKDNSIEFLDYPIGEDVYFNLQIFDKTEKIAAINDISYKWFFNEDSISNTSQKGFSKKVNIIYFLEKITSTVTNTKSDYFKYFLKRYYIWYLLFSGKNSSSDEFLSQYKEIAMWTRSRNLQSTIFPLSKKLAGEGYKNRIIVLIFDIIEKLHLIPLFAKFYCKKVQ